MVSKVAGDCMAKLLERKRVESHFGALPGSGHIEQCAMSSDILGVTKDFSVYLPFGYEQGEKQYPVLYLLHPAGGTHETWIKKGYLSQIADDAIHSGLAVPMVIVMPDASGMGEFHLGRRLGFFSVGSWDYEAYFHKELVPLIDSEFHSLSGKHGRAIAGASMGGEAAIAYAQKKPDFYDTSCSLSGILGHPEQSRMAHTDKDYATSLIANDPTAFVRNATTASAEQLKSVRWYADCGDRDFFYEGNVDFFLAMKGKSIPIEYRMRSGAHGWYYWITGFAQILQYISVGFLH